MIKNLQDKQIRWYPTRKEAEASYLDKPHLMSEDVKEAVLEFENQINHKIKWTREHNNYDKITKHNLIMCYKDILADIKAILGDWNK